MKIFIRSAVAAIALGLVGVTVAEAQLVSTPPPCTDWTNGYTDCAGAFAGNNKNQEADVFAEIIGQGWLTGPISVLGGVDVDGNSTSGTINFGSTYTDFVLALKAGDSFSLYYYAGSYMSIDYNTVGSGTNEDVTNALSHWTLYGGEGTSVPEPTTLFLLGTGLLGMSMLGWRRREEIIA